MYKELEPACRICLTENISSPYIFLLESESWREAESIFSVLGVSMTLLDISIYPNHICGDCRDTIQKFLKLKHFISQNEQFLTKFQAKILENGLKYAKEEYFGGCDKGILNDKENKMIEEEHKEFNVDVKIEDDLNENSDTFALVEDDNETNIDDKYLDSIDSEVHMNGEFKPMEAKSTLTDKQTGLKLVQKLLKKPYKDKNCKDDTDTTKTRTTAAIKRKEWRLKYEGGICVECNKFFRDLASHKKNFHHIGLERLQCPECPKTMLGAQRLRIHLQNTHSTETVSCPMCGPERKLKKVNLANHLKEFHKEKEYPCDYKECKVMFKKKRDMKKHIRKIHLGEKELCSECGIPFKDLNYHLRTVHSNMSHPCELCKKVFVTKESLNLHKKNIHNKLRKKEVCDICAKEVFEVEKHIKYKHSGLVKKSIPCMDPQCDKMFRTKQEVNKHNDAVHLNKKETCPRCDGIYKNLAVHINQYHTGAKKHVCDKCGKAFIKKYDLNVHIDRVHCGRRYICPECGKTISKIKEHLKVVHNKIDVNMEFIKEVRNPTDEEKLLASIKTF